MGRFAWARLNAYGVLVAVLALLSMVDLFHPGGTDLARLVGEVPPGQAAWVTGFVIAGILMLHGFIRTDRITESIALGLLLLGLLAQSVSALIYLGFTEFTTTRLVLVGVTLLVTWARFSVLWAKQGLDVHIPARGETERER